MFLLEEEAPLTMAAVAMGPRLSTGGIWEVRMGSKCVDDGGEGRYGVMRGDGLVLGAGRSCGSISGSSSQDEIDGRRAESPPVLPRGLTAGEGFVEDPTSLGGDDCLSDCRGTFEPREGSRS